MLVFIVFVSFKIVKNHDVTATAASAGRTQPGPAQSDPIDADGRPSSRPLPSAGDKSPAGLPRAGSGGVSRHRRGRRAFRLVQARRRLAIDAEHQRRLALIPLSGPGPAPGTGDGAAAERSGNRQPTAPDAGTMPCRVERRPKTLTLRIGHLNVRSLMPSIDDVIDTLDSQNLDILCLSETWLKPDIDNNFLVFPGYRTVRRDRPGPGDGSGKGGGVCVIHRETLRVETLKVASAGRAIESLWLSVMSVTTIVIGVIYRPPSAPVSASLDDIQDQLAHAIGNGKPVYLLGDFNFDLLQPARPEVRRYIQIIQDLNMKQLVTDPTRPESGSLIDHILVRSTDDVTTARVIPNSCSDHDLVVAETPLCRERRRRAEITVRSTRGLVPDRLRLDLLLADWSAVYGAAGTEEKWSAWRAVWTPVIDAHMPLVKMRPRHKPCPWLNDNDDLRQLMRERDPWPAARR